MAGLLPSLCCPCARVPLPWVYWPVQCRHIARNSACKLNPSDPLRSPSRAAFHTWCVSPATATRTAVLCLPNSGCSIFHPAGRFFAHGPVRRQPPRAPLHLLVGRASWCPAAGCAPVCEARAGERCCGGGAAPPAAGLGVALGESASESDTSDVCCIFAGVVASRVHGAGMQRLACCAHWHCCCDPPLQAVVCYQSRWQF